MSIVLLVLLLGFVIYVLGSVIYVVITLVYAIGSNDIPYNDFLPVPDEFPGGQFAWPIWVALVMITKKRPN